MFFGLANSRPQLLKFEKGKTRHSALDDVLDIEINKEVRQPVERSPIEIAYGNATGTVSRMREREGQLVREIAMLEEELRQTRIIIIGAEKMAEIVADGLVVHETLEDAISLSTTEVANETA